MGRSDGEELRASRSSYGDETSSNKGGCRNQADSVAGETSPTAVEQTSVCFRAAGTRTTNITNIMAQESERASFGTVTAVGHEVCFHESRLILRPVRESAHRDLILQQRRARRMGKRIGRPSVTERDGFAEQFEEVTARIGPGGLSLRQAARDLDIGFATLKRLLDAGMPTDASRKNSAQADTDTQREWSRSDRSCTQRERSSQQACGQGGQPKPDCQP